MSNLENKLINKTIASGVGGLVGLVLGSGVDCVLNGKSPGIDCVLDTATTSITSDLEDIWLKFSLPGQIIDNTINKYDYKSVIGTVPPLICKSNQEGPYGGFCYDKSDIPPGYEISSLGRFTKPCNSGERDDGVSCWNDLVVKGRGTGYTDFNYCGQQSGNTCEKYGLLYYPKCQDLYGPEFSNSGCCLCSNNGPTSYIKQTAWITPKVMTSQCPSDTVNHIGICYKEPGDGYTFSSPGVYTRPKQPDTPNSDKSILPEVGTLIGIGLGLLYG